MTPAPPADPPRARDHAWRVLAAVAIGLAVHGWLVAHTGTTARDSVGFAQLALQYQSPDPARFPGGVADVLTLGKPPHPPGYPLAVLATSEVVRATVPGEVPDLMLLSTQLASVVAAALWAVPCYALGALLFGRFEGFAAALLLQILPVVARVCSDGLTEAWYLLFYTSAAAAGTWAARTPSPGKFALAGLFSGLAYLVRPEGLIVAIAVACAAAWLALVRRDAGQAVVGVACVALGAAAPAGPYMATVGGVTLKPALQDVMPEVGRAPVAGPLFAVNFNPETDGSRAAWVPKAILREGLKTAHYGVAVYGLIGLGLALASGRERPWLAVTLALGALNLALIVTLAARKDYISERHTIPVVVLATFYAGFSLAELPRRLARLPSLRFFAAPWWKWVGLAALAISCLAVVFKPLHEGRTGHRLVGDYLKAHATAQDLVIDPYTWAQFFSGRSLDGVPPDPARPRYRWAILEEGEGESNSKFTRLDQAKNVAKDRENPATLAFSWPDPDRPGRRVALYRQAVKP